MALRKKGKILDLINIMFYSRVAQNMVANRDGVVIQEIYWQFKVIDKFVPWVGGTETLKY